jgi:hypothetical protein
MIDYNVQWEVRVTPSICLRSNLMSLDDSVDKSYEFIVRHVIYIFDKMVVKNGKK